MTKFKKIILGMSAPALLFGVLVVPISCSTTTGNNEGTSGETTTPEKRKLTLDQVKEEVKTKTSADIKKEFDFWISDLNSFIATHLKNRGAVMKPGTLDLQFWDAANQNINIKATIKATRKGANWESFFDTNDNIELQYMSGAAANNIGIPKKVPGGVNNFTDSDVIWVLKTQITTTENGDIDDTMGSPVTWGKSNIFSDVTLI